jgi:hypothetical protein
MDVKSAYLNEEIKETIYIKSPPGYFESIDSFHGQPPAELSKFVLLLKKALYGTKQGVRGWYKKLAEVMKSMGFRICGSDQVVFIKGKGEETQIIAAAVESWTT